MLKFLILLRKFLKLKSSSVTKRYHRPFLQSSITRIGMIETQRYGWKRDSKYYFQNFYLFPIARIYHKLLLETSIISRAQTLSSQAKKDVSICWRRVTKIYEKYDAGCTFTPLATKTRRSVCTRPTVTKVFDKLSRAVSVKYTSYNWRNGKATYLVLLTRYCTFDIQRNRFHCKTLFAWYEISVSFSIFIILTIADLLEKIDSN